MSNANKGFLSSRLLVFVHYVVNSARKPSRWRTCKILKRSFFALIDLRWGRVNVWSHDDLTSNGLASSVLLSSDSDAYSKVGFSASQYSSPFWLERLVTPYSFIIFFPFHFRNWKIGTVFFIFFLHHYPYIPPELFELQQTRLRSSSGSTPRVRVEKISSQMIFIWTARPHYHIDKSSPRTFPSKPRGKKHDRRESASHKSLEDPLDSSRILASEDPLTPSHTPLYQVPSSFFPLLLVESYIFVHSNKKRLERYPCDTRVLLLQEPAWSNADSITIVRCIL